MKTCVVLLLLCTASLGSKAQLAGLPDSMLRKIDRLFEKWDSDHSPGVTVGIVRNDSLIFSKGYGMANLEYSVENTPASIFHVASVSKQFTAYAIALLAGQGRLKLTDDVRQYLPWFPDMGSKITIAQLLHHTSGIRDQWQLLAIAGTRLDDVITQEQIIKILSRQHELNSKPGDRFNYCNSGYTMAAEIVKAVTGKTLRAFTDSAIFKPLGMRDTHFHDDYTEVVHNRTYSYFRGSDGKFHNAVLSYSNTGATSLFTNINDLAKWVMNFYAPKAGAAEDIKRLLRKTRLNGGKEIDYALGISHIQFRGRHGLAHNGADAGYRTALTVFPGLKMGFIVLANRADFDPNARARELAALFIPENGRDASKAAVDSSRAILQSAALMRPFEGSYISDEGTQMKLRLSNNKLYADAFGRSELLQQKKDTFYTLGTPAVSYVFNASGSGDTSAFVTFSPGETALLKKAVAVPQTQAVLDRYTGMYYSDELQCYYGITVKDGRLVLTNSKYEDVPLRFEGPDYLLCDRWWMSKLRVLRDSGGVTGFEVNDGRVLHLRFKKISPYLPSPTPGGSHTAAPGR